MRVIYYKHKFGWIRSGELLIRMLVVNECVNFIGFFLPVMEKCDCLIVNGEGDILEQGNGIKSWFPQNVTNLYSLNVKLKLFVDIYSEVNRMITKNDDVLHQPLEVSNDIELSEKFYIYREMLQGRVMTLGMPLDPIFSKHVSSSQFSNTAKSVFAEQFHNFMDRKLENSSVLNSDQVKVSIYRGSSRRNIWKAKCNIADQNIDNRGFKLSDLLEYYFSVQVSEINMSSMDSPVKIITLKKLDSFYFEKEVDQDNFITKNYGNYLDCMKDFQNKSHNKIKNIQENTIFSQANFQYLKALDDSPIQVSKSVLPKSMAQMALLNNKRSSIYSKKETFSSLRLSNIQYILSNRTMMGTNTMGTRDSIYSIASAIDMNEGNICQIQLDQFSAYRQSFDGIRKKSEAESHFLKESPFFVKQDGLAFDIQRTTSQIGNEEPPIDSFNGPASFLNGGKKKSRQNKAAYYTSLKLFRVKSHKKNTPLLSTFLLLLMATIILLLSSSLYISNNKQYKSHILDLYNTYKSTSLVNLNSLSFLWCSEWLRLYYEGKLNAQQITHYNLTAALPQVPLLMRKYMLAVYFANEAMNNYTGQVMGEINGKIFWEQAFDYLGRNKCWRGI